MYQDKNQCWTFKMKMESHNRGEKIRMSFTFPLIWWERLHGLWRETIFPLVPAIKGIYCVDLEIKGTEYLTHIKIIHCFSFFDKRIVSTTGKENFKRLLKIEEFCEDFSPEYWKLLPTIRQIAF